MHRQEHGREDPVEHGGTIHFGHGGPLEPARPSTGSCGAGRRSSRPARAATSRSPACAARWPSGGATGDAGDDRDAVAAAIVREALDPRRAPAAGAQRHRRHPPHQPRPRAAGRGGARAARRPSPPATRTSSSTSRRAAAARARITSPALICELTGAEAALCVNNGAAALVLALARARRRAARSSSRAASWSRSATASASPRSSQSAGARLREVGTTNRTRAADYDARVRRRDRRAALRAPLQLPRASASPARSDARELAEIAHGAALPLVYDVGSGALLDDPRAGRRAARPRRAARRRDARLLLGRQAARRPAGRHPRRHADAIARLPAPPAGARAAHRQALAGRARGHAAPLPRPGAGARRAARCCAPCSSRADDVRARAERARRAHRRRGRRRPSRASAAARCRCAELPSFGVRARGRRRPARGAPARGRSAGARARRRRRARARLPHAHRRRRGRISAPAMTAPRARSRSARRATSTTARRRSCARSPASTPTGCPRSSAARHLDRARLREPRRCRRALALGRRRAGPRALRAHHDLRARPASTSRCSCVACDDGVMPQTREHVAILELLGVRTAVVALTKRDLVDDESAELAARRRARTLLAGTALAGARRSSRPRRAPGTGLDELRDGARRAPPAPSSRGPPRAATRLPIDRAFTLRGIGTVVTGTLWSGVDRRRRPRSRCCPAAARCACARVQVHDQPCRARRGRPARRRQPRRRRAQRHRRAARRSARRARCRRATGSTSSCTRCPAAPGVAHGRSSRCCSARPASRRASRCSDDARARAAAARAAARRPCAATASCCARWRARPRSRAA